MAPKKKTLASQQPKSTNLDYRHFVDKDKDIFKTQLFEKLVEGIKNLTFSGFTDSLEDILVWECGLAQEFNFPEFIHMRAQSYDPIQRVVKSKNNQYILFPISEFSISELLLVPDNQERLEILMKMN